MKTLSVLSLLATCLTLPACGAAPERAESDLSSEHSDELDDGPRLLALGDSMAFGWDPLVQTDPTKVDPSDYQGYAEVLGKRLSYAVDNASCPGEGSASLVDPNAKDNGCDENRAAYGLHVDWDAYAHENSHVQTQLDFIEGYLANHVDGASPVELITLDIGGNDLLLLQDECQLPFGLDAACKLARLPFYEHGYRESLRTLFEGIAAYKYTGPIVVLTTYIFDYSDKISAFGVSQYNASLREAAVKARDELGLDILVADGFGEFETRSAAYGGKACDAGLLIHKPDGTCDIHPSPAGHEALADAIQGALDGGSGGAF